MKIVRYWIPLAVTVMTLSGVVYLTVQQTQRLSANDPQIQIAQDLASELSHNGDITSFVSPQHVDIAYSLSPFIIIYNDQVDVLYSSATLHGQTPQVPRGIFSYVQHNGEDRFTWQPEPLVRMATVVTRYAGEHQGYVLVGRSLSEVEKREDMLFLQVALGCITSLVLSLLLTVVLTL